MKRKTLTRLTLMLGLLLTDSLFSQTAEVEEVSLFTQNLPSIFLISILVFLFIYYLVTWYFFGREPQKESFKPNHLVPYQLSPAVLGFIDSSMHKQRLLKASLADLLRKKIIEIQVHQTDSSWTLKGNFTVKLLKRPWEKLPIEQELIVQEMFGSTNDVANFTNATSTLIRIEEVHRECLHKEHGKILGQFVNFGFAAFAIIATAGGIIGSFLLFINSEHSQIIPEELIFHLFPLLFVMLVVYLLVIRRKTVQKSAIQGEIAAFRSFLRLTPSGRKRYHAAPPPDFDYEEMLPYAIALGIER